MLNKLRIQKSQLTHLNFIENIILSKLNSVFKHVHLQKNDEENYLVEAEYGENRYTFHVSQTHHSRYALENVVFDLKTVRFKEHTLTPFISFLYKDSLQEVIGVYLQPYENILAKIENNQSKVDFLIHTMAKDLESFEGFQKCEEEGRYIEIVEKLVVHNFYSNTVTISIIPYNQQFNISLEKTKEVLVEEWNQIFPKVKTYLNQKYQPKGSTYNLFELFEYYFRLSEKVYIDWNYPSFCISNIVLGAYEVMQVSSKLIYNEKNEMISVCIESLGELLCEEKPFCEVIPYLEEIEKVIC